MAKKPKAEGADPRKAELAGALATPVGRPSALLDTRVIHCGDCLEQPAAGAVHLQPRYDRVGFVESAGCEQVALCGWAGADGADEWGFYVKLGRT